MAGDYVTAGVLGGIGQGLNNIANVGMNYAFNQQRIEAANIRMDQANKLNRMRIIAEIASQYDPDDLQPSGLPAAQGGRLGMGQRNPLFRYPEPNTWRAGQITQP